MSARNHDDFTTERKNDEIVGILPQKLLAEEMQETALFVEQKGRREKSYKAKELFGGHWFDCVIEILQEYTEYRQ